MKKAQTLILFLLQLLLATAAFGSQDSIDEERSAKLKQALAALASADGEALRSVLSSEHQAISSETAASLVAKITSSWGDMEKLEPVDEASLKTPFDKGDMHVLARWGTLPTQYGRWMLFRGEERKDRYLRIGLLFAKGGTEIGQFVAAEFPVEQETQPSQPDPGGAM